MVIAFSADGVVELVFQFEGQFLNALYKTLEFMKDI